MKIQDLPIASITIGEGRRPIDVKHLAVLKQSIQNGGLNQPITVRRIAGLGHRYELLAGAHRLKACEQLGWRSIPAIIKAGTSARLAEIEDNLLRAELTLFQKYECIVAYIKLSKPGNKRPGMQPHDQGFSRVASLLKLDRRTVGRAAVFCKLKNVVRRKIQKAGKSENASFVDGICKIKTPAKQLKAIGLRTRRAEGQAVENESAPISSMVKLKRQWKKSPFRRSFERANKQLQGEFVRTTFRNL